MGSILDFVHLHVHTEYSLLDGAAKIKSLVSKAAKMNMKSIAITDHGVMYGAVDFYKAAKDAGIKPIIGCEIYTAARGRQDKTYELDADSGHLVLLAKDSMGYQNLSQLVSFGFTQGFYFKPRVDRELLEKHSEGLIALSGCIAGDIPSALLNGDYNRAKEIALYYKKIFGKDNFYIEIQDHGLEEQKKINPALIRLSAETGIGLVATNDIHYINKEDAYTQDVLMCVQMGKTIDDPDRMKFKTDEFYLKSGKQMSELFEYAPEAIENTVRIAERCNVDFDFNTVHLPAYDVPDGKKPLEFLEELCMDGLKKRYSPVTEAQLKRLEYELDVINSMGFVDYFLIVWDFIKFARDNGIVVGPGRGSGAGSIVAYCLGITSIDPMKYNLLFERFLNPERISMPDIDTDFCYERRQEVIDYVIRKYGSDRVTQIITFGTLQARAAIRDVGRVLNIPLPTVDMVAKLVPLGGGITLNNALKISVELKNLYDSDAVIKKLVDTAISVEGLPRHAATHAAGVVISKEPIYRHVPLQTNKDIVTTQYSMDNLSDLGLVKMDFLGLRNLTVIRDAIENIYNTTGKRIDISNIGFEHKEVYEMIGSGDTTGVFQLESAGMRSFMKELRPDSFEDIIAGISLYRPGPMEQIPRYIDNKNNAQKITYKHPILEPILNVTYGCFIYQEQVLQIAREMAGYSLGRADLLRRAMSKKKADVMENERKNFIYGQADENGNIIIEGAIRRGVPESVAAEIFDEIMDFASYGFNKSHAAAYAVVAYQTAYLKRFYPLPYMAALITSTMDSTTKVVGYINYVNSIGIKLLPPDINKSYGRFTVEGESIRFGLEAVKNVGKKMIAEITEQRRRNGEFVSFTDFCERMGEGELNKRSLEGLIKCGCFDSLGIKRSSLMAGFERVLDSIHQDKKKNIEGQISLFDSNKSSEKKNSDESLPDIDEFDMETKLAMEKETIGLYLSGHPLDDYKTALSRRVSATTADIYEVINPTDEGYEIVENARFKDGDRVIMGGIITSRQNKTTKSNAQMAFLTLEDLVGFIEVIVFPKKYSEFSQVINEGAIVTVSGRINIREDEEPKLILEGINILDKERSSKILYIKLPIGEEFKWNMVKKELIKHKGSTPVTTYFEGSKTKRRVADGLWVTLSDELHSNLVKILGEECVVVKG